MVVHVVVHVVADRYRVERRWSGASTRQWTSTRAGPPPPASLPALRGVPAPDVTPLALALVAPLPFRRFDTAAAAAVAATAAPCWSLVSAVEFSRVYVLCSSFTRTHDAGWVQKQSRRWSLALRPEHHPRSDQSGHVYRAANLQDTLSEGPARAAQHVAQVGPSAVTASAVGGSATRSVVAESLRRPAAR